MNFMNITVMCFERSVDWKSAVKMQDHLPFEICIGTVCEE